MIILTLFSFLAGFITILSPCILPILPLILSGGVGGKKKATGVVLGFVLSFSFFTLTLSSIVQLFSIGADTLRLISAAIIALLGLSMITPAFQHWLEALFSRVSSKVKPPTGSGFSSGLVLGANLGLVWTPCAGPILAAVITLAASSQVTTQAALITVAYALGTALPMFAIMMGGRAVVARFQGWSFLGLSLQQLFGLLTLGVAVLILFGGDRAIQTWILSSIPNYASVLTQLEKLPIVKQQLELLK